MELRKTFINVGHAEGVSYLLLLLVAMPLKYLMDMPEAVRLAGTIHGILFVAFVVLLAGLHTKYKLKLSTSITLFLLSIVPFGTFFLERYIANKEA
jgi:integral membrane protein